MLIDIAFFVLFTNFFDMHSTADLKKRKIYQKHSLYGVLHASTKVPFKTSKLDELTDPSLSVRHVDIISAVGTLQLLN